MAEVIIRDVSPAQLEALTTALTAGGIAHTTDTLVYTAAEATALLDDLAARQRGLLEQVAGWDGVLPAEELRDAAGTQIRGITGPITKAVKRLIAAGVLRPGLQSPVRPVYDPNNRAFQRVRAFKMDSGDVASFAAAVRAAAAQPAT